MSAISSASALPSACNSEWYVFSSSLRIDAKADDISICNDDVGVAEYLKEYSKGDNVFKGETDGVLVLNKLRNPSVVFVSEEGDTGVNGVFNDDNTEIGLDGIGSRGERDSGVFILLFFRSLDGCKLYQLMKKVVKE